MNNPGLNPQQYSKIFKQELDPQGLGSIAKTTFITYINKQPNPPQLYEINELFNHLAESNKMSQKQFLNYMIAFEQGLSKVAVAKFAMKKQIDKYQKIYTGSAGPSEILTSYLAFQAVAKNQPNETKNKNLSVSLGKDNATQAQKRSQFNQVLGRDISEISLVIKLQIQQNQQQIRSSVQNLLNEGKALAMDMLDPTLTQYINLLQFQVKVSNGYIYIFLQLNSPFLNDSIKYIQQAFNSINPSIHLKLGANIESTQLQQFIDELGSLQLNKMKDLFVKLFLQIDSNSKNAINHIMMTQNHNMHMNKDQMMSSKLLLLLENVELEAKFTNTEELLKQFGLDSMIMPLQEMKDHVKQFELAETIGGFLPSFTKFYELIKSTNKEGSGANELGQISLNLGNFFVRLEFNLNLQALITLL